MAVIHREEAVVAVVAHQYRSIQGTTSKEWPQTLLRCRQVTRSMGSLRTKFHRTKSFRKKEWRRDTRRRRVLETGRVEV